MKSTSFSASRAIRLSLLPVVSCLSLLWPQSGSEHLTVGQAGKIVGKRNAAVETKIPVTILEGFHVNSNTPSEEYLIPLSVKWTSLGSLEGPKVAFPKATNEKYEFSEKPLSVFTGKFDLTASFKIAANAPAGPGIASGKLHYQACNNKACFRPADADITVPYQVQ